MSSDLENAIAQFIQGQFPDHVLQDGADVATSEPYLLVDFVEAYFEYIEANYADTYALNRKLIEYDNIDTTVDDFLEYFRRKYLDNFPYVAATDDQFLIKHILDLYRSKGTERAVKLLIRMLFNKDARLYYPGKDILRASHSKWKIPHYIEIETNSNNYTLLNKTITGSSSGATAFVDSIVTKRVNGVFYDVLYLSNIVGTFVYDDYIYGNGAAVSPKVTGSLNDVTIVSLDNSGISIGDILDVQSVYGDYGKAKVTELYTSGRTLQFNINDTGSGITTSSYTEAYISDLILFANTETSTFEVMQDVTQVLEQITFSNEVLAYTANTIGTTIDGLIAGSPSANATIIDITDDGTDTTIIVQHEYGNSFLPTYKITTTGSSNVDLDINEVIEEEATYELTLESIETGNLQIGDTVYQETIDASGLLIDYAIGTISDISNTVYEITNAFGTFTADRLLYNITATATANVANVSLISGGTTAYVSAVLSNTEFEIRSSTALANTFVANTLFRGLNSNFRETVSTIEYSGVDQIRFDATDYDVYEANSAGSVTITDIAFTGKVISYGSGEIKIATIGNTYYQIDGVSKIFNSENGNSSIIIDSDDPGRGSYFEIGGIKNGTIASLSTLLVGESNIAGVPIKEINLNANNSQVIELTGVTVSGGGLNYANGEVITFTGGGIDGNEPVKAAIGLITTNGSGTITSVAFTNGQVYSTIPSYSIDTASGSGASLTLTYNQVYGLRNEPYATANTPLGDILDDVNITVGEIDYLDSLDIGTLYTNTPTIHINTPLITEAKYYDQILTTNFTFRSPRLGEVMTQANTGAQGVVRAYDSDTNKLTLKRLTYNAEFAIGFDITGSETFSIAEVSDVVTDATSKPMGNNAIVALEIESIQGAVKTVTIVDSGVGYRDGETVTLISSDGETVTGTADVIQQGLAQGYWETKDAHISDVKKLHDNYYYQEYSYDVKTPISLYKYREQIKDIIHIAGTKFFGSVEKQTIVTASITASSSIIQE